MPSTLAYHGSFHTSCSHTPVIRDEHSPLHTLHRVWQWPATMCSLSEVCYDHESLTSCVLQVQTDIRAIWSINKSTDFIQGTCHIELMQMKTRLWKSFSQLSFQTHFNEDFVYEKCFWEHVLSAEQLTCCKTAAQSIKMYLFHTASFSFIAKNLISD